jgi:phytoene dehydrogenase-like protein
LAVISHVENAYGVFTCKGGIYRLAEALAARARELGVELVTSAEVEEIVVENRRACAVRVGGQLEPADYVIVNGDIADVYHRLLKLPLTSKLERYKAAELSLSAYLLLALAPRAPLDLAMHNVFFSRDYEREFEELIDDRRPPMDPTVYVCAEDRSSAPHRERERYYLLTNAPPLDERGQTIDWHTEAAHCRARVEQVLARHRWKWKPIHTAELTPRDFAQRFPGSRGAIYGLASNSRSAAFSRPANQLPRIERLYFCGGSVHPGAGLPMVTLSARIAARLATNSLY